MVTTKARILKVWGSNPPWSWIYIYIYKERERERERKKERNGGIYSSIRVCIYIYISMGMLNPIYILTCTHTYINVYMGKRLGKCCAGLMLIDWLWFGF